MLYDVIVVGGGPAGAIAAKYLAKANKKVLLLQKDLKYKKPCGGGLRDDAFKEFEIDRKSITHMVDEIVIESKKEKVNLDISTAPLAIVDRVLFDSSLREDALKSGATLKEAKVTKIQVKSNSVIVLAKEQSQTIEYEAKYIIAADGANSTIRKQMRNEYPSRLLTNYCDVESVKSTNCTFYLSSKIAKGAYSWKFPYNNGSDIGLVESNTKNGSLLALLKLLKINETVKVRGFHIPNWEKPIFYENRVFYVGDSAEQVLPFTYEGIYYAMASAKLLANVIASNANPSEYEKRWNDKYYKKFSTLKKLQKFFLKNEFTINLMMKALSKPLAQEKLVKLWIGNYNIKLDKNFYLKAIKRLFQ